MTLTITHNKVATLPDQPGVEVNKAEWNDAHGITGDLSGYTVTVSQISNATIAAGSSVSGTNTGDQDLSTYALLASPTFTGVPAAPTAANGTNTTQLATTAYVDGSNAALMAALVFFGSGKDGNVTINSGTTSLSRDMYYNNLTLSGTVILKPNGFKIYVSGTLDISAAPTGAITYTGSNGGNSGGSGAGSTASFASGTNATLTAGSGGQNAGAGSTGTGSNATGPGAKILFNGLASTQAGDGGAGGTGGAGTAGAPAANTQASFPYGYISNLSSPISVSPAGQTSGGGGGGGDGSNAGGGGGGTGAPGGHIWVAANIIARGSNSNASVIQSIGGNGGTGFSPAAGNTGGGGAGAGAGGGTVLIYYASKTGSAITNGVDVTGGNGGTGGTAHGVGSGNGNGGGSGPGGYIMQMSIITGAVAETIGAAQVARRTGGTTTATTATASQANI